MKKSDNSIIVLNGGLFTYVPKVRNGEMLSYKEQVAYFYSLFKDLAQDGKIVAMVRGTEEHRILKNHKLDVLGILQEALGLNKKVCNDALINIRIDDDMVGDAKVGIRTINWNNNATTGAYIGRKMEERAIKKGDADIYLARTTMNFFRTAMASDRSESNAEYHKKPVYLISSGSYTPFKGAMTAGAEYNSIKDSELCPPSFWYKVTVEQSKNRENVDNSYIVRVNPINYCAHHVLLQGTDKITANIENIISQSADQFVQKFVDKYSSEMLKNREVTREKIREMLIKNNQIDEVNTNMKELLQNRKNKDDEKKIYRILEDLSQIDKLKDSKEQIL